MDLMLVFEKLGIALGLGLLVGLQRERVQAPLAGIRTFALLTLFGAVSALLGQTFGGWVVALGALAVAGMLAVGNLVKFKEGAADPGITTETAALLMYGVGAYVIVGHAAVGIALGGTVAVLLHFKAPMHAFVAKIGENDLTAIMQFVLIALVILPIVPDQTFGPYQVLNPHRLWLMVVLIVGLSLGGYVAFKFFGEKAGAVLGGILGGLISSTATTVSYARQTRQNPDVSTLVALVLIIATAISMTRVLIEVAVVAPDRFPLLAPALAVMLGWLVLLSVGMYFVRREEHVTQTTPENPAQLKTALVFGVLFAVVLLGVAAAKDYLGEAGLYGIAAISGIADMDAITLSTAELVETNRLEANTGWRLILLAALTNLVFKGGAVAFLGDRRLLKWMLFLYGAAIIGGVSLLLLWPSVQ